MKNYYRKNCVFNVISKECLVSERFNFLALILSLCNGINVMCLHRVFVSSVNFKLQTVTRNTNKIFINVFQLGWLKTEGRLYVDYSQFT